MPTSTIFSSSTATNVAAQSTYHKRMSVTQVHMIAHQAWGKLAKEANCLDHNLHRLVCHANMLDTLICGLTHTDKAEENYLDMLASGK